MPAWPIHCMHYFFLLFFFFFFETKELLSQFIGYYAGRGHPQYNKSDLTVSLATARQVEVRQPGLRSQGGLFFSVDPRVFAHCVADIPKGLDGVPLTMEIFTYPVETLSPFSRPFCLRGLCLFDSFIVTLALFVEARAPQHGEEPVAPQECQGVHHGVTNKQRYARHYFRISAGMSPCLISTSLIAMARATSTTTMPTSRA